MAGGRAPDRARVGAAGRGSLLTPLLTRQRVLRAIGIALALAVLLLVFQMYLHPDMILEFSNLIFCA